MGIRAFARRQTTVHPHACGEHTLRMAFTPYWCGSSPRLWGTYTGRTQITSLSRFIPTPVGNMASISLLSSIMPVHPHACGEHKLSTAVRSRASGSSPRLWGTSQGQGHAPLPTRFIPTPVGNIKFSNPLTNGGAVHPHACGEHAYEPLPTGQELGSSPRLWGTYQSERGKGRLRRFIPTPVGNIVPPT